MSRYKLVIYERVSKSHEVIIDTDKDIEAVCNKIEDHVYGINSVWDIEFIDGVSLVKVNEDEDGLWLDRTVHVEEVTE